MEKHPHCSPKGGDLRLKIDNAVCQFFVHVVRDTDKGSTRPAELKCCTCPGFGSPRCEDRARENEKGTPGERPDYLEEVKRYAVWPICLRVSASSAISAWVRPSLGAEESAASTKLAPEVLDSEEVSSPDGVPSRHPLI
jgi:hypothetical protein